MVAAAVRDVKASVSTLLSATSTTPRSTLPSEKVKTALPSACTARRSCGFSVVRRRILGVDRALVPRLVAAAEAGKERRLQASAATRDDEVAAAALGSAVEDRPARRRGSDAAGEIVRRILREERHDAAERVAAVERRRGAAHDLGALQRVEVERELMDVERARSRTAPRSRRRRPASARDCRRCRGC